MSIWTLKGHDELWGKSPFGIWTGFNLSFGECLCCIASSLVFFQADPVPLRKALGGSRKALHTSQAHSLSTCYTSVAKIHSSLVSEHLKANNIAYSRRHVPLHLTEATSFLYFNLLSNAFV